MKISNVTILSTDLINDTAKISFTILEATENVNVYLKINDEEYKVIFLNEVNGDLEYTVNVSRGVNNLLLKATDSTDEYISEPIQVLLKEAPTIENLECSYSDSTGKYILNFAFNGDTNFKYNIYLKLDADAYIEVLSNQISGDKIIEQTSTMGEHTCILKVSDGYDDYIFPSFQFKITNHKPILSKVLVTDITNNGEAYIYYATKDIESSTLTHKLVIGNTETVITPTQVDNFYSYKVTGLSEGISNCTISISDGIDTVSSDVFSIEVFPKTTDKKETLRRAKVRYDSAYQQLRDIIVSVISDLKYDYDIENALITKAQDNYKIEYSNFNKIFQQSIDMIGSNKVTISKQELQSEISDVDSAINNLENTMWGVFQDGILDQSEREALNSSLDLVAKEKTDIDRDYETLYNNEDLTDPSKTKLQTSYNNFIVAHNSLVTTIDDIINKAGIVDNTDKSRIDSAFENWRTALGNYRVASLEAIDSIAKKKADNSADIVDKKWAEIVLDPETGIKTQVGSLQSKITGTGGIEERLKSTEQKLTADGIITIVKDNIYTKNETDKQMSSIQQSINGINGAVSSLNTTVNENNNNVTSQMSSIQEAINGIDVAFDELTNTVNNIQVGARNYLRNSNFKNQKENWSASHSATLTITESNDTISSSCPFKNGNVVKVVQKVGQNHGYITQDSNGLFELEVGASYTFSGFIYADTTIPIDKVYVGKFDIVNNGWTNGKTKSINERGKWIKFEYTFTATSSRVAIVAGIGGASNRSSYTVYGTGFKLEKGNKATDWSPAPEDTDSTIDTMNKNISSQMSSFQQTVNNISSEVGSLKVTVDNNNKNVTSQMSSIKQTVDGISSEISSIEATVDNNNKNMTSQMSSIKQTVEGINSEFSSLKVTVDDNNKNTTSKILSMQQTVNGINSEITSLKVNVDGIQNQTNKNKSEIETTKKEVASHTVNLNNISSRLNTTESTMTTINNNITNIEERVSTAEQTLTKDGLTTIIGDSYTTQSEVDNIVTGKNYATKSEVTQTKTEIIQSFTSSGGYNLLLNSNFARGLEHWTLNGIASNKVKIQTNSNGCPINPIEVLLEGTLDSSSSTGYVSQSFNWSSNEPLTLSWYQWTSNNGTDGSNVYRGIEVTITYTDGSNSWHGLGGQTDLNVWQKRTLTITPTSGKRLSRIRVEMWARDTSRHVVYTSLMLEKGTIATNWTPNPNEMHDGIITLDKDGVKVEMQDGEGSQGYSLMSYDGFSIFDSNNNRIAWFGQDDTSYINTLYTNNVECNRLVKLQPGRPQQFYVNANPPSGSNGSGTSVSNACRSITEMFRKIKSTYGQYSNWQDITINVAEGSYYETVEILGFMGCGKIYVNINANAKLYGFWKIYDNTMKVVIDGERTGGNNANNGAQFFLTDESITTLIHVRNSVCMVKNVRSINKCRPDSSGDKYGCSFIHVEAGRAMMINCDVSRYLYAMQATECSIGNVAGSRGYAYTSCFAKYGSHIITSGYPNEVKASWSSWGGHVEINGSKYESLYDSNYESSSSTTPSKPSTSATVFSQSFALENLKSIPEGSGSPTSKRSGVIGQGKWSRYKPHRGWGDIPSSLVDFCKNSTNISMTITMTRQNTNHGYAGAVPSPKFIYSGGTWDSNTTFARGATKTITLPSTIVNAIANGSMTSIQLYAGYSTNDYSFYQNITITVRLTKNI